MVRTTAPLQERMAFNLHDHFATSNDKVGDARLMLTHYRVLRRYSLGNFSKLAHAMAKDHAMQWWLDMIGSNRHDPNENFARELMELFTLGIGNYSERDVQEAARAFTGWSEVNGAFAFDATAHDDGEKTVFGKTGAWRGEDIVKLCFAERAASRFIAGKLLRFFLHPDPPEAAVQAFAELIERHRFALEEPLATLFRSRAFYSAAAYRSLVKSPVELVVGTARALGLAQNGKELAGALASMGQALFLPATVKGWAGHLAWISPASLIARCRVLAAVAATPALTEAVDLLLEGELDTTIRRKLEDFAAGDRAEARRETLLALMLLPEYQVG
jgi:uncharacterized protein (DUF1800 family)